MRLKSIWRKTGRLLKLFLHISKQEQAERLKARLDDPHKNWKFESADLEMRKKWPQFIGPADALNCCSVLARIIVPADRKWYQDFVIAHTVVAAMEKPSSWPKPKEDLQDHDRLSEQSSAPPTPSRL
jgi:polyphosphate kinase 2 (PPK2 family)